MPRGIRSGLTTEECAAWCGSEPHCVAATIAEGLCFALFALEEACESACEKVACNLPKTCKFRPNCGDEALLRAAARRPDEWYTQGNRNPGCFVKVDVAPPSEALASASLAYTYYDAAVSRVEPRGGPATGGTMMTLRGAGLADFGGIACRYALAGTGGEEAGLVPASAAGTVAAAGSALLCAAPKLPPHLRNGSIDIHLSLNGDTAQPAARRGCHVDRSNENLPPAAPPAAPGDAGDADDGTAKAPTDDASCFMAYDTSSVRLHGVHPLGGPHRGGTALELSGSNFADYGGVACRFGALPRVRATLVGGSRLRCVTPPNGPLPSTGRPPLRVTLNENDDLLVGDADGGGDLRFSFFDEANVRTINLIPDRGGGAGSTKVTVSGSGFADYGGAYCRFGALPLVAATVQDANTLVCFSPPNRMLVPDTSEDTSKRRPRTRTPPPRPRLSRLRPYSLRIQHLNRHQHRLRVTPLPRRLHRPSLSLQTMGPTRRTRAPGRCAW